MKELFDEYFNSCLEMLGFMMMIKIVLEVLRMVYQI